MGVEHILPASVRSAPSVVNFDDRHFSTQLKFIKTGSSKAEHAHNNLYRYSKIYVNIEYSTIKYSRIKKKSITILVIIQRVDNKAFIKPCSSGFWRLELGLMP